MKTPILAFAALALALGIAPGAQAQAPASSELPSPLDIASAIGYALDHNYAILQAKEAKNLLKDQNSSPVTTLRYDADLVYANHNDASFIIDGGFR